MLLGPGRGWNAPPGLKCQLPILLAEEFGRLEHGPDCLTRTKSQCCARSALACRKRRSLPGPPAALRLQPTLCRLPLDHFSGNAVNNHVGYGW